MSNPTSATLDSPPPRATRIPWKLLQGLVLVGGAVVLGYGLVLSQEGLDSPRFEYASGLFSAAAFAYLVGFAFYLTHLARGRDFAGRAGSLATLLGAVFHTSGIAVRWTISGWIQPPWTNLYESLIYFAWGIVVVHLIFEWRSGSRAAGAFVIPTAMILMGLAAFSLESSKEIPQIMPALQSRWIQIHVSFACVAYAAFMTAFGFAILFLIKDRLSTSFMAAIYGAFAAVTLLSFGSGDVPLHAEFPLTAPTIIGTGDLVNYPKPVPYAGQLFLVAFLLYLAVPLLYWLGRHGRARAGDYLQPAFIAAFGAHTAALVVAVRYAVGVHPIPMRPELTLLQWDVNAYRIALAGLVWMGTAILILLDWRAEQLAASLPKKQVLDEWSHKAILVGLPLMALNLITGAIWANNAWGSYWSWDPKETWALITFLTYAAYIHMRMARGWGGRKAASLAVVGFAVVLFTYLGVNLFLSGLHSYGSPG